MSTPTMPERLATLEADMRSVRNDVVTIKGDVKTLLLANASGVGALTLFTRIAPWVAIGISVAAVVSR